MNLSLLILLIVAPICYAAINHIDKYLLSKYFKGISPAVLVMFSSLVGLLIAPILLLLDLSAIHIPATEAGILILSGILFILHTIPYFFALDQDETSLVAPLFLISPVIAMIFGYIFLGEILTQQQILGSLLVLMGSFGLLVRMGEGKAKFKWGIFWLMSTASFLIATQTLLFKVTALQSSFITAAFWQFIGFVVPASAMLAFSKKFRKQLRYVFKVNATKVLGLNLGNELLASVAVLTVGFVSLSAPLGLVVVIAEGTQPFFVLLFGILLSILLPKIAKEDISKKALLQKFIMIIVMFMGVAMINM